MQNRNVGQVISGIALLLGFYTIYTVGANRSFSKGREVQGHWVKSQALMIINNERGTAALMNDRHRLRVLDRIDMRINAIK